VCFYHGSGEAIASVVSTGSVVCWRGQGPLAQTHIIQKGLEPTERVMVGIPLVGVMCEEVRVYLYVHLSFSRRTEGSDPQTERAYLQIQLPQRVFERWKAPLCSGRLLSRTGAI
jgi:hypothetical protein